MPTIPPKYRLWLLDLVIIVYFVVSFYSFYWLCTYLFNMSEGGKWFPTLCITGLGVRVGLQLHETICRWKRRFIRWSVTKRLIEEQKGLLAQRKSRPFNTEPRLECKICFCDYTNNRAPLVLKECGHTICEDCAGELYKKPNDRYMLCPFCRSLTILEDPIDYLPKNYAIIEYLEERRSQ